MMSQFTMLSDKESVVVQYTNKILYVRLQLLSYSNVFWVQINKSMKLIIYKE